MAEVVATKVVDEVAGSLLTKVKKEIGYMWNCKENVEKLRREVGKLKDMKDGVELKIKLAKDNCEQLLPGVERWVEEALGHITKAEEFLHADSAKKTCFNLITLCNHGEQAANKVSKTEEFLKKEADAKKMCFNFTILHRYHYGKEATNKVSSLDEHQRNGKAYEGEISIPTPSVGTLELLPMMKNINDLGTHNSLLEKITGCVLDENIQITGIYGIGGVGKTTLAREVVERVKYQFDLVVFVTVSRPVDVEKIKKEVDIAAKRIIRKGEKILIILDDVWDHLQLHTVGIPCPTRYPSCKILLTSRIKSVCSAMNAHPMICVESLPMEEAWVLFKSVVSERVETDTKLNKVARKVVEGCGGLPLILQAVGKALKDEENFKEWKKALKSIKKHKTSDIHPDIRSQFAHLQLSYDYLKSEEAKSIFLLCSMFPEDFDIPLERLAYYGVGLELFKDLSLEDARNKVQGVVKTLKSSCLLLDGYNESTTKMHDVVREVALLIASKDDNKFLVEAGKFLTEWEPRIGTLESYTGISLMFNHICKLPDYELKIPRLNILLIQYNSTMFFGIGRNHAFSEIPDEFTQAMKEAKVIDFEHNNIHFLPKSLNQLTRLRMLNLGGNRSLRNVSILGELKQLEILILSKTGITEIPQEIGELVKLRLFHVEKCHRLSHIAPGVLSKLRWLEELSIGYYPVEEVKYNSLVEIGKSSKLAFLNLCVPHICLFPEGDYMKRLKTFLIQIGEDGVNRIPTRDRTLILDTPYLDISHSMHVRKLIEVCNDIRLVSIKNLDNIMPMMCCEGFGLKNIFIRMCANLLCLVDSRVLDVPMMQTFHPSETHEGLKENTMFLSEVEYLELLDLSSLKEIWNCPDHYISLNNLVTLKISFCSNLEKLFTVSVAQGLVNLQKLKIQGCDSLKEVISDGDEETSTCEIDTVVPAKNIVFTRLAKISLDELDNLTSFYPRNATIKYPSLVEVKIRDCDKMEKWGYGTHDTPNLQLVNYTEANGSTIDETLAKDRETWG